MKRLIFLTAVAGLSVLGILLLIRGGPGGVPVQAQEPPPPPPPPSGDTLALIQAKEAEATRLAGEGQNEAVAALHDEIRTLIRRLMMELPESPAVLEALEVKARIEGLSSAQLDLLKTREAEASAILAEARTKMAARGKIVVREEWASALPLIAQVETQYADTSAAYAALADKYQALILVRRFDEAYAACMDLIARTEPTAPASKLIPAAKAKGAFSLIHRVEESCKRAVAAGSNRTPDMLASARADCDRVVSMGVSQQLVARARSLTIEVEIVDLKPDRAEMLGEALLTGDYAGLQALQTYPEWVLDMHLFTAEAARLQGKTDKALRLNDEVKALYTRLSPQQQESLGIRQQLQRAYFQNFLALSLTRSPHDQLLAAGQEVMTRFPGSRAADYVRRRLGLPATTPAP